MLQQFVQQEAAQEASRPCQQEVRGSGDQFARSDFWTSIQVEDSFGLQIQCWLLQLHH